VTQGAKAAVSTARILLADDDADTLDLLKHWLSQRYEVEGVVDGAAALTSVYQLKPLPDLVLADVRLIEVNGFEVLRSLRANPQTRELPIILLSAPADEEACVAGLEAGADDYVIKPFSERKLLARIEANLRIVRLRQEAACREQESQTQRVAAQPTAEAVHDKIRAEEGLRQREAELTLITNALPILIAFVDSQQRYRFNNRGYEEWFGHTATEVYGKHFREILGESAYEAIRPYVEQALAGQQVTYETQVSFEDGRTRYISATYIPQFDRQGNVEGFVALVNDISDAYRQATLRKQIEMQLQRSNERFELAASAVNCLIYDWNIEQDTIERTEGLTRILGYSLAEAEPTFQWWREHIHPEDLQRLQDEATVGLAQGDRYVNEYRIRNKDNQYIYVLDQGLVVARDGDGRPIRIVGSTTDITDRKRAEEALRASEERFRVIVNQAAVGLMQVDLTGRFVLVNQRYCDIVGYSMAELLEKRMQDITHPDDLPRNVELFQRLVTEAGNDFSFEKRYICKNGSEVWVSKSIATIYDAFGKPQYVIAVVLDVTDRKRAEAERAELLAREQQANRVKDEFLAVLSHELRSPLNPILGWSKLLRSRKFDEKTTNRALETIERSAQVQTQLIEDLLDVSRILQGKLSLNVCPVDLTFTIQAAMETVHLAAQAKSIQIQTRLEPDVGHISGDPSRLQQVIWNLLSNAVKFTPQGGRVEVRLSTNFELKDSVENPDYIESDQQSNNPKSKLHWQQTEGAIENPKLKYAQITVSDTGKGIAPDFLPYVFDYFRQADSTTTRKFGGLGLGLAITRNLVELHGGTIQADSLGEGQGATFIVSLPLMPTAPKTNQDSRQSEQSPDLNGVKLLVVDDDASAREYFTFLLELHGASVTAVASAGEGFTALIQSKPDVLLSDIGMPDVDGYMFIQQVRSLPPEQGGQIPAIALTAYAGEINYQQALSAGFQRHVSKPVEPAKLVEVIANLIGGSEQFVSQRSPTD